MTTQSLKNSLAKNLERGFLRFMSLLQQALPRKRSIFHQPLSLAA